MSTPIQKKVSVLSMELLRGLQPNFLLFITLPLFNRSFDSLGKVVVQSAKRTCIHRVVLMTKRFENWR
jgi:hypothetical protein